MTPLKAALASPLKRRFAIAAAIVATTGATAGVVVAAAHTTTPAPAQLAASASPAPSPSPKAGTQAHRHPLVTALVAATAKETGLSVTTIRSDLQSGQTLDQIAGSKAGDVENDVLTRVQSRLDKAVAKGRITKDQETDLLNRAKSRIEKLMSTPLKQKAQGTAQPAA